MLRPQDNPRPVPRKRIEEQRKLNDDYVAERNKPPPF
jgi:hypothetical protein